MSVKSKRIISLLLSLALIFSLVPAYAVETLVGEEQSTVEDPIVDLPTGEDVLPDQGTEPDGGDPVDPEEPTEGDQTDPGEPEEGEDPSVDLPTGEDVLPDQGTEPGGGDPVDPEEPALDGEEPEIPTDPENPEEGEPNVTLTLDAFTVNSDGSWEVTVSGETDGELGSGWLAIVPDVTYGGKTVSQLIEEAVVSKDLTANYTNAKTVLERTGLSAGTDFVLVDLNGQKLNGTGRTWTQSDGPLYSVGNMLKQFEGMTDSSGNTIGNGTASIDVYLLLFNNGGVVQLIGGKDDPKKVTLGVPKAQLKLDEDATDVDTGMNKLVFAGEIDGKLQFKNFPVDGFAQEAIVITKIDTGDENNPILVTPPSDYKADATSDEERIKVAPNGTLELKVGSNDSVDFNGSYTKTVTIYYKGENGREYEPVSVTLVATDGNVAASGSPIYITIKNGKDTSDNAAVTNKTYGSTISGANIENENHPQIYVFTKENMETLGVGFSGDQETLENAIENGYITPVLNGSGSEVSTIIITLGAERSIFHTPDDIEDIDFDSFEGITSDNPKTITELVSITVPEGTEPGTYTSRVLLPFAWVNDIFGSESLPESWKIIEIPITIEVVGGTKVNWDANGGTWPDGVSLTGDVYVTQATAGTNVRAPSASVQPSRTGYSLLGWAKDNASATTPDANLGKYPAEGADTPTYYAVWEKNRYTVTYQDGKGVAVPGGPYTVNYGESHTVQAPASSTTAGYTFQHWSDGSNTYVADDIISNITDNITLTAVWNEDKYTVTFEPNGGAFASGTAGLDSTTGNVVYSNKSNGESVDVPTPNRTGYKLTGWSASTGNSDALTNETTVTVSKTITYTAQWKKLVKVTWAPGDGATFTSSVITEVYGEGGVDSLTTPDKGTCFATTPAGKEFAGWSTTPGGKFPASDTTYTAQWRDKTYTVKFHKNDGTSAVVDTKTVTHGQTVEAPTAPTRGGYQFGGWYQEDGCTNEVDFSTQITEDKDYYAKWDKIYTITWEAGTGAGFKDGKGVQQTGISGTTLTTYSSSDLNAPTGKEFDKWTNSAGDEVSSFPSSITKDETYTANWKDINYKLTFKDATYTGSQADVDYTKHYGDKVTPPDWTREGYTLTGWTSSDTGLHANLGSATAQVTMPAGDITFTAVWEAKQITVTWSAGEGGSVSPTSTKAAAGTEQNVATASREGYTFTGWTSSVEDIAAPGKSDTTFTMPTKDVTFTAQWQIKAYDVTFKPNGGTFASGVGTDGSGNHVVSVNHGSTATVPNISWAGYTLSGWNASVGSNLDANASTTGSITQAVEYTAQWTANKVTVKVTKNGTSTAYTDMNGKTIQLKQSGTVVASGTISSSTATISTTATQTVTAGQTYEIWIGDETSGYKNTQETVTVPNNGSVTDYAIYYDLTVATEAASKGMVTLEGNSSSLTKCYLPGETGIAIAATPATNYSFTGWTVSGSSIVADTTANGASTTVTIAKSATTVTAKFVKDKVTVTISTKLDNSNYTGLSDYTVTLHPTDVTGTESDITATLGSDGSVAINDVPANKTYAVTIAKDGTTVVSGKEITVAEANVTETYKFWTVSFYKKDGTTKYEASDGADLASRIVLNGEKVSAPTTTPTETGFTFGSWVTTKNGTTEFDFGNTTITATTGIYSRWKVTVTWNVAEGETLAGVTNPVTDYPDEKLTAPNGDQITKSGHRLNGWYTATTGGTAAPATFPATSTTYYAQWTANTLTVTVKLDGTRTDLNGDWIHNNNQLGSDVIGIATTNDENSNPDFQALTKSVTGTYTASALAGGTYYVLVKQTLDNGTDFYHKFGEVTMPAKADGTKEINFYTLTTVAQKDSSNNYLGYVATGNNGGTTASPETGSSIIGVYSSGSEVHIHAAPITNYKFTKWTGGTFATPTDAGNTFRVNGKTTLTANFEKEAYSGKVKVYVNGTQVSTADGKVTDQVTDVTISGGPDGATPSITWVSGSGKNYWEMNNLRSGSDYTITVTTPTGKFDNWTWKQPADDNKEVEAKLFTVSVAGGAGNEVSTGVDKDFTSGKDSYFTDKNDSSTSVASIVIPAGENITVTSNHKSGYTLTGWVQNDTSNSALPTGASVTGEAKNTFALTTDYAGTSNLEIKPVYTYELTLKTWYDATATDHNDSYNVAPGGAVTATTTASGANAGTVSGSNGVYIVKNLTPGATYTVSVNGFTSGVTFTNADMEGGVKVRLYKVGVRMVVPGSTDNNPNAGSAKVATSNSLTAQANTNATTPNATTFYLPQGATSASGQPTISATATKNSGFRFSQSTITVGGTAESALWTAENMAVADADKNKDSSAGITVSNVNADMVVTAHYVKAYTVQTKKAGTPSAEDTVAITDKESNGTVIHALTTTGTQYTKNTQSATVDANTYVQITATPATGSQLNGWTVTDGETLYSDTACSKALETDATDSLLKVKNGDTYTIPTVVYAKPTSKNIDVTANFSAAEYEVPITVLVDDKPVKDVTVNLVSGAITKTATTDVNGVATVEGVVAGTYSIFTGVILDGSNPTDSGIDVTVSTDTANNKATVKYYTAEFDGLTDANPNSIPARTRVENGTLDAVATPTKKGYVFAGWTTTTYTLKNDESGSYDETVNSTARDSDTIAGDKLTKKTKYTATWTENSISLTLRVNGSASAAPTSSAARTYTFTPSNNTNATLTVEVAQGDSTATLTSAASKEIVAGETYTITDDSDTPKTVGKVTIPAAGGTNIAAYADYFTLEVTVYHDHTAFGSVSRTDGSDENTLYVAGETVAITATANTNYTFATWDGIQRGSIPSGDLTKTNVTYTIGSGGKNTAVAYFQLSGFTAHVTVNLDGQEVTELGDEITKVYLVNGSTEITLNYDSTKKWYADALETGKTYTVKVTTMTGDYSFDTVKYDATDASKASATANLFSVTVADGDYGNKTNKPYIGSTTTVKKAVIPVSTTVAVNPNPDTGYTLSKWVTDGNAELSTVKADVSSGSFSFDSDYTVATAGTGLTIKPVYTYTAYVNTWYDKDDNGSVSNDDEYTASTVVLKNGDESFGTDDDPGYSDPGKYRVSGLTPGKTYEIWVNGFKATSDGTAAIIAGETNLTDDNAREVQLFKVKTAKDPAASDGTAYVALGTTMGTATEVYVPQGASSGSNETVSIKAAAGSTYRLAVSTTANGQTTAESATWTGTTFGSDANDAANTVIFTNLAGDITATANFVLRYDVTTDRVDVSGDALAAGRTEKALITAAQSAGTTIGSGTLTNSAMVDATTYVKIEATAASASQLKTWKIENGKLYKADTDGSLKLVDGNPVEITEDTLTGRGMTINLGTWGDYTDTVVYFIPNAAGAKVTAVFEAKRYKATINVYLDNDLMTGVDSGAATASLSARGTMGDGNGTLAIKLATSSAGATPSYYTAEDGTNVWTDDDKDGIITIPNLPVRSYDIYTNALSTFKNTHEDLVISNADASQNVYYYTVSFDTRVRDNSGNVIQDESNHDVEADNADSVTGGSVFADQTVSKYIAAAGSGNEHVVAPSQAPEKAGYKFLGWAKYEDTDNDAATDMVANSTHTRVDNTANAFKDQYVSHTTQYRATWQRNDVTINVELDDKAYEAIDGTATLALDSLTTGDPITITLTDGDGVFTAVPNGTYTLTIPGKTDSWTVTVNNDQKTVDIDYYTVKFDLQGGTSASGEGTVSADDQIILSGGTVTRPSNPTKSGYTFKGWYTTDAGNTEFNFSTAIRTTGTIIYAQWTQNQAGLKVTDYGTNGITADAGQTSTRTTTDSTGDYKHQDREVKYSFNAISGQIGASGKPYKVSIENTATTALTVQLEVFKFDSGATIPFTSTSTSDWPVAETISTEAKYNWTTADSTTTAKVKFDAVQDIALAATGNEGAKKQIAEITVESTARNKDDGVLVFRFTSVDETGAVGPTVYYVFDLTVDPLPIVSATIEAKTAADGTIIVNPNVPGKDNITQLTSTDIKNVAVTQGSTTSNANDEQLKNYIPAAGETSASGDLKYQWFRGEAGITANDFTLSNGVLSIKPASASKVEEISGANEVTYTVTDDDLGKNLYMVVYSAGDDTNASGFAVAQWAKADGTVIQTPIPTKYVGKIYLNVDGDKVIGETTPNYTVKLTSDQEGVTDVTASWVGTTTDGYYAAELLPTVTYKITASRYQGNSDLIEVTGQTFSATDHGDKNIHYYTFKYDTDLTVKNTYDGFKAYLPDSTSVEDNDIHSALKGTIKTGESTYSDFTGTGVSTSGTVYSVPVLSGQTVRVEVDPKDMANTAGNKWSDMTYQSNHTLSAVDGKWKVGSATSGIAYAENIDSNDIAIADGIQNTTHAGQLDQTLFTVKFLVYDADKKASGITKATLTLKIGDDGEAASVVGTGTGKFRGTITVTGNVAQGNVVTFENVPRSDYFTVSAVADSNSVISGYRWQSADTAAMTMNGLTAENLADVTYTPETDTNANLIKVSYKSQGVKWQDDFATTDTFVDSTTFTDTTLTYGDAAKSQTVRVYNNGNTELTQFYITPSNTTDFTVDLTTAKLVNGGSTSTVNVSGSGTSPDAGKITLPVGAYVEFEIGYSSETKNVGSSYTGTYTAKAAELTTGSDYTANYTVKPATIVFVNGYTIDTPAAGGTPTANIANAIVGPANSLSTAAGVDNTKVTWTGDRDSDGKFKSGQTYTATVVMKADENHVFSQDYIDAVSAATGATSYTAGTDTGYYLNKLPNNGATVTGETDPASTNVAIEVSDSDKTLTLTITFPATAAKLENLIASSDYATDGEKQGKLNSITVTTGDQKQDIYYVLTTVADGTTGELTAAEIISGTVTTTGYSMIASGNTNAAHTTGVSNGTLTLNTQFSGLDDGTKYYVYAVAVPHGTTDATLASNVVSDSFTTAYSVEVKLNGDHGNSQIKAPTLSGGKNLIYVQAADDLVPEAMRNDGSNGIKTATTDITVDRDTAYTITSWTKAPNSGTLTDDSNTTSGNVETIKKTFTPEANTVITVNFSGTPALKISGDASGGNLLNWKYDADTRVMDPIDEGKTNEKDYNGKVTNTGTLAISGNAELIVTKEYIFRDGQWKQYTDAMFEADMATLKQYHKDSNTTAYNALLAEITSPYFYVSKSTTAFDKDGNTDSNWKLDAKDYGALTVIPGNTNGAKDETGKPTQDAYSSTVDGNIVDKDPLTTNRLSYAHANQYHTASATAGDLSVNTTSEGDSLIGIYRGTLRAYDSGYLTEDSTTELVYDTYRGTDGISLQIRVIDEGWAGSPSNITWDLNPRSHGNNSSGNADPDVAKTHVDWTMKINAGDYQQDDQMILKAISGTLEGDSTKSWTSYSFTKDTSSTSNDKDFAYYNPTSATGSEQANARTFNFHQNKLEELAYLGYFKVPDDTTAGYFKPQSGDQVTFAMALKSSDLTLEPNPFTNQITITYKDTRPGLDITGLTRDTGLSAVTARIVAVQHDGGPTDAPKYVTKTNLTDYSTGGGGTNNLNDLYGLLKNGTYDAHVRWYSVTPAQYADIEAKTTVQDKFNALKALTGNLVQQCGSAGITGTDVLTYNYQTSDIGNYLYCTVEGDNVWFRDVDVSQAAFISPELVIKALRTGTTDPTTTATNVSGTTTKATLGDQTITAGGTNASSYTMTFTRFGDTLNLSTLRQDTAKAYYFTNWDDLLTATAADAQGKYNGELKTTFGATEYKKETPEFVMGTSTNTTLIAYYDLLPTLGQQVAKYDLGVSDVPANRTLDYVQHDGSGNVTVTIQPVTGHTFADGSTAAKTLTNGDGLAGAFTMNSNVDLVSSLVLDADWIKSNLILSGLSDGKYIITVSDNLKTGLVDGKNVYDVSTEFVVTRSQAHITLRVEDTDPTNVPDVSTDYHGEVEITNGLNMTGKSDTSASPINAESEADARIKDGAIDSVTLNAEPHTGYAFEGWYIEDWKDGELVYYKAGTADANKYGTFGTTNISTTDGSATVSFTAKVPEVTVEARFKPIQPVNGAGNAQKGSDTLTTTTKMDFPDGRTDTTKNYEIKAESQEYFWSALNPNGWLKLDPATGEITLEDGKRVPSDLDVDSITINATVTVTGPDGSVTRDVSYTLTLSTPAPTPGGGGGGGSVEECPVKVYYWLGLDGTTSDITIEDVYEGDTPKNVPAVKALDGLTFLGWSLTKPEAGKTVTLVDPKTVTITADTTFYAVYADRPYHEHYVIGYPNGNFGPADNINRASVATIIARAILPDFVEGANYGNPGGYSDVSGHWAESAIAYCSKFGVFEGYLDGTFKPDQSITRQEIAVVIARIDGMLTGGNIPFSDADEIGIWAVDGIYTAYEKGWINGYTDGTFRPMNPIRRDETVKIFNAYLNRGVDKDGLSDLKEYVHSGVASNVTSNGEDEYMTWPDVPKTQWAYYEIIEAANDHEYKLDASGSYTVPEHWTKCWIDEKWRYHDDLNDGGYTADADRIEANENIVGNK